MGADVRLEEGVLSVTGPKTLRGIDIDLHDIGETTPTVAALAALADGPSVLRGIAHLRGHETDRLAALATEIGKLGGAVTETADGLRIEPRPLHGAQWHSYADQPDGHRRRDPRTRGRRRRHRGRRHHGEDAARVRELVDGHARRDTVRVGTRRAGGAVLSRRVYDESDVRIRPGKGSRPRTKNRPEHADAAEGMVVSKDRGRWGVVLGGDPDRLVVTMRAANSAGHRSWWATR